MRFIFILIIGLFLFQAPSANAADPAGLNAASQEKKKKSKKRRIKVMSKELSKKMMVLNEKLKTRDFEGVINMATDYLSARSADSMDIYYMNQVMAIASLEQLKYEPTRKYYIKAYEAGKELNPRKNKSIIPLIAQSSMLLEEYNETLHWYDKYEEAYGPLRPSDSLMKGRALYFLSGFETVKTSFIRGYSQINPSEWSAEDYESVLRVAIKTQDRELLLNLANKIHDAKAGVMIEEAITILKDEQTPLTPGFAKKMKIIKFKEKKENLPDDEKAAKEIKIVRRAYPDYPMKSMEKQICGFVIAEFTVKKNGRVRNIKIIDSKPKKLFDKAVKKAIKKFIYEPRVVGGKKVDTKGVKTKMIFKLANGCKE